MLNIPNSIKTLYQTDGIRKNFRVHFPNGEYSDITNSAVVSESVKFTESLSSQSTFKFGLAEASVLEFESVGVGNMFGMTIEASMEIDTSSLSAADITAIQADEGDGTLVLAADSDIGYGFYRIPLGTFRVDKCPRNHGAMAHRQVTAYSLTKINKLPKIEQLKLQVGTLNSAEYTPNIQNLFYSLVNDKSVLTANGYTRFPLTPTFVNYQISTKYIQYIPVTADQPNKMSMTGGWYGVQVRCIPTNRYFVPYNDNITWRYGTPWDRLYSLTLGEHYKNWVDDIVNFIESTLLIDYDKLAEMGYSSVKDFIYPKLTQTVESVAPTMIFAPAQSPISTEQPLNPQRLLLTEDIDVFYPYLNESQLMTISLPHTVSLYEDGSGGTVIDSTTINYTDLYGSEFKIYAYQGSEAGQAGVFESTGQRIYRLNTKDYNINTFIDSYDPIKIGQGLLEMNAQFHKDNRLGGSEIIRLNKDAPIAVTPNDYSECWWDEYDVEPIGTVTITYMNSNDEESTEDITIGDGASRYDMSSNEAIKHLGKQSLTDITDIITNNFAPYIDTVAFTPTELSMQGRPWLEAGDALEITAEDGTIVETYALRVEMSGIQHLQSAITAEGGEIIEEVG